MFLFFSFFKLLLIEKFPFIVYFLFLKVSKTNFILYIKKKPTLIKRNNILRIFYLIIKLKKW